jgi:hypothetical protein
MHRNANNGASRQKWTRVDTTAVAIGLMPPSRKDPGDCTPSEIKAAVVSAINEPAH